MSGHTTIEIDSKNDASGDNYEIMIYLAPASPANFKHVAINPLLTVYELLTYFNELPFQYALMGDNIKGPFSHVNSEELIQGGNYYRLFRNELVRKGLYKF